MTNRIEQIKENQDEKDETTKEEDSAVNTPTHIAYTIGTMENDHTKEGTGNKSVYQCDNCHKSFVQLKSFKEHECFKRNGKIFSL